jgi:hypothetical protein
MAGALADDQRGGEDDVARRAARSRGGQQLGGLATDLGRRLRDDAERRRDQRGPRRVVEADEGDVVGHAAAALAQRPQRAQGHQVVGDEDGVGWAGPVEQRARGPVATLLAEVGSAHQRPVHTVATLGERVPVARQAGRRVAEARRSRDAGDARGAAVEQVLGREPGAEAVVDQDRVDRGVLRPAVDGDHGDARVHQRIERRPGRRRHRDDDARHAIRDGDVDVGGLLVDVLVGVAQHEPVVLAQRDVLDAADHRGEERVLDVGDDRRPQRGALPSERPGRARRLVAERLGRLAHPVGPLRRHGRRPVQHP